MRRIYEVVSLLRNNSSLILVPASAFGVYLVIASKSHLAADDLYFFLSGIFSLCSILDGGLPYKISAGAGRPFALIFICRKVLLNLLRIAPFLGFLIAILIWSSPFGAKHSSTSIIFYALLGLGIVIFKVLIDAARVVSLKSSNRLVTDGLTSAFGIARFVLALFLAGLIPYIIVFGATLIIELFFITRLNDVRAFLLLKPNRFILRRRLRFDWSYVKANFAYNAAFNIDRIAAFYILTPDYYRALIGITSLYNMSILPHKIVENELLHPSKSTGVSRFTETWLSSSFCGVGCSMLLISQYFMGLKFKVDISSVSIVAGVSWVTITTFYNRIWSVCLRDFNIKFLANINLVASLCSLIAVYVGHIAYDYLIPVGLLFYSAINFLGLFINRMPHKCNILTYVLVACVSSLVSIYAITLL